MIGRVIDKPPIICGGGYVGSTIQTNCVDITRGSWSSSQYLPIRPRYGHVTWNSNPGESLMLLWGWDSQSRITTDIVHSDGTVTPGFKLKYDA